ncbi:hypothetical protein JG688_00015575 [Phytophthora aleatoria]|uniref:Uncharacterized protein n=1 Tax=Phytophthora aleatoria TaxID=2496075 RepID=A0A8J5MDC3_9STRA|nr:hypothetical protein GQ600_22917 [Phytophthora cactorum]KAG6947402.1 hypothetical protein JG688_00015575 [Phytophthora aleatoria]
MDYYTVSGKTCMKKLPAFPFTAHLSEMSSPPVNRAQESYLVGYDMASIHPTGARQSDPKQLSPR